MGYWKEKMMEDEERGAIFVKELIESDHLEGAALGVAKLWLDKGEDVLTEKQQHVLDEHVFGPYVTESCGRCSQSVPWSEMMSAYHNGGLCGYCQHVMEKDD